MISELGVMKAVLAAGVLAVAVGAAGDLWRADALTRIRRVMDHPGPSDVVSLDSQRDRITWKEYTSCGGIGQVFEIDVPEYDGKFYVNGLRVTGAAYVDGTINYFGMAICNEYMAAPSKNGCMVERVKQTMWSGK